MDFCSVNFHCLGPGGGGGGGKGTPLYKLYVCAVPKGIGYELFWSEIAYRF